MYPQEGVTMSGPLLPEPDDRRRRGRRYSWRSLAVVAILGLLTGIFLMSLVDHSLR